MSKISAVHHISLKPATPEEFEKTLHFYCDLLGLPVQSRWTKPDGTMLAMLDAGNCCLEIVGNGRWPKNEHGSLDHLAFCTNDVDGLLALVEANGYQVTSPAADITLGTTPPTPVRNGFCRGPLGELVEFFDVKRP